MDIVRRLVYTHSNIQHILKQTNERANECENQIDSEQRASERVGEGKRKRGKAIERKDGMEGGKLVKRKEEKTNKITEINLNNRNIEP